MDIEEKIDVAYILIKEMRKRKGKRKPRKEWVGW